MLYRPYSTLSPYVKAQIQEIDMVEKVGGMSLPDSCRSEVWATVLKTRAKGVKGTLATSEWVAVSIDRTRIEIGNEGWNGGFVGN